jgi:lipoprotein-anchoring transpeptidase ErfK/SrfK
MSVPYSHGCIRMRNGDVIELFNMVTAGMPVELLA